MKKRGVNEIPMPPEETLYYQICQIPNEKQQAFAAFVYMAGGRVSEIIGTRRKDKEGKLVKDKLILLREGKYQIEPIRKWDLEFTPDGFMLIHNVPTLKRRGARRHMIPVFIKDPTEARFFALFKPYLDKLSPEDFLFSFNRFYAYQTVRKYMGTHAHFLRSMRATKDSVYYDIDATGIQRKYDWATPAMAMLYAQKNVKDVMAKMARKN